MSTKKGTALVTGAGKRIGRVLAIELGARGYHVGVHYRSSAASADEVVKIISDKGGTAHAVQADLSDEAQTASLVSETRDALGPLSLLVNNASLFENDDITTMTRDSWDDHLDTNLRAPVKLIQDFAAQTDETLNNLAVNIIDQRVLKLTPQFFSYTLSKSALWSATKTLAQALGPRHIRVNGIGPGPILRNDRQSENDWQDQNKATILGHGATPDEIWQALAYLIEARSVTGQMIAVDGGQHLTWQTPDVMVKE